MFRDDYLMRQIEKAMEAVARAFGSQPGAPREEAEAEIDRAYDALLEHNRGMLDVVDARTLARLVGWPSKVRALARVSKADGDLRGAAGEEDAAARCYARALTLLRVARDDAPEAGDDALLSELERLVG